MALARAIRSTVGPTPIVVGGYHASSTRQRILAMGDVDGVVQGDGEDAALRISDNVVAGRPFHDGVPGLVWRDGDQLREHPPARIPPSRFPVMDFGLLKHRRVYPTINLLTTRGCPWKCAFCLEETMRGYTVQGDDWLQAQLDNAAANVTTRRVFFCDPIFGLSRKRLDRILPTLEDSEFRYCASTRADALAIDQVPGLKQAGFDAFYVGVESSSPDALLRMNKVPSRKLAEAYAPQALDFLTACFEHDITPIVGFLFGYPGDTAADYEHCIGFLEELAERYAAVGGPGGYVTAGSSTTRVLDGTRLADEEWDGADVGPEDFLGDRPVLRASESVDGELIAAVQKRRQELQTATETARVRGGFFGGYPIEALLREHGEPPDGVLRPSDFGPLIGGVMP